MAQDDRLTPLLRAVFTPLAVLTAIFGPALLFFAGSTEDYWAWPMRPNMSAIWIGAGYTFGALAITTMLVVGRWTSSIVAIVATFPFAVVMLGATLVHWDRFLTDTAGFYVWLAIYAALPVALPAIYLVNRRRDPGAKDADVLLPSRVRLLLAAAGVPIAVLATWMLVAPVSVASVWPWTLSPLGARVIAGWLLFVAAGGLCAAFEPRYAAYRYFLPSAAAWFAILLIASLFNTSDFDGDAPETYVFFAGVALAALTPAAIFALMESRLRWGRGGSG